jgi:choline dehydrogenase-like flavoprotein
VYAAAVNESRRVIVVGSGPAGAAAALFLCRAGVEVLLLEAGSKGSELGLTARVRGLTVFRKSRPLGQRRDFTATQDTAAELFEELAPGGLTNHWSCAVPRFSAEDFADAERAGEPYKWPITYDDIAPWYDKVEPLLKIAGGSTSSIHLPAGTVRRTRELSPDWTRMADAAGRVGRSIAPTPYVYGAETTLTLSGTVFNAFVRLVKPELRAGRASVRYDARVLRLEWSARSKRVEAVIFHDTRTGAEDRVPCRAVVLATGAVRTAEILLASSSAEFPKGLGNEHGVLGHYLHDHPLGKLVVDLESSISMYPAAYVTRPALQYTSPLYAAACLQWSGVDALVRSALRGQPGRAPWVGFSVFGTMAPTLDNWVSLEDDAKKPGAKPGLKLHIRHPSESTEALEKARDDVTDVLTRAGLKPRTRVWHVEPVGNSKHYGGTCRMHASPRFGMLDGWSRLHAVRNVAVADSAAFTTGPEKNPVLTAMTLAARASHRLGEELKAGDL